MFETYFSVRENIPIEGLLEQASCLLASAKAAAYESDGKGGELSYASAYLLEMAKALVDAATSGLPEQAAAEVNHA